ncbi:Histidine kinase [Nocardioides exalbidus]|uniref:Histidine kinase n=1 Tax=Nocardioides exalbidus TaxID=402596 RepID=A0A1H4ZZX5_9ACTN|nr:histidine kinase [Nocardioides exalbidus]SED35041.1 Histidine kinase [Nocardioides exalbidus]
MLLTDRGDRARPSGGVLYTWRVTTAIRVFALALAVGIVFSEGHAGVTWPLLAALAVIAGAGAVLDWTPEPHRTSWTAAAEMLLAALVLGSADASPGLYAYLAAPPVLTGVRHGVVTTINVTAVGALGVLAAVAGAAGDDPRPALAAAGPWLLSGLGAGLLTSWQSRSLRDQDARRAPYEAAHQLMAQLHGLARRREVGLDTAQVAEDLGADLRRKTGALASAVYSGPTVDDAVLLSGYGDVAALEEQILLPAAGRAPDTRVLPIQGTGGVLGHLVLGGVLRWNDEIAETAAAVTDDFALRMDTAVLFDELRQMATSEERNRLAREMHDGVAQEIVALGYVVDEIESVSDDPRARELAASLRDEITRVVGELRYSIYDLRHQVSDHRLSGALAEYVRDLSNGTDLRVHLTFEESGPALSGRTEAELLRVAQEAISNVRRHSRAKNLWVGFLTDGHTIDLRIEDDGIGHAGPKDRHWGLTTMAERATGIGATLQVGDRPGGGTRVHLHSDHPTRAREGSVHP